MIECTPFRKACTGFSEGVHRITEKDALTKRNIQVKKHKKELIIAGVSIAAIIAVIIGIKNHKALEETWASLGKLVEKTPEYIPTPQQVPITDVVPVKDIVEINIVTTDRMPHDVAEHLRNLPEGWKASAEKIATSAEHGYELLPGQTWVEAYRTGGLAA